MKKLFISLISAAGAAVVGLAGYAIHKACIRPKPRRECAPEMAPLPDEQPPQELQTEPDENSAPAPKREKENSLSKPIHIEKSESSHHEESQNSETENALEEENAQ